MSSVVISGNTSGTITLDAPAVAGTTTLTLPATSGTVITTGSTFAGTGPAFSAYANAGQILTSGVSTRILYGAEEFDTNNNYASSTFTPTVAGYYQINAQIQPNDVYTGNYVTIFKNGSIFKTGNFYLGGATGGSVVSALVYCNGTTDTIDIFGLFVTGQAVASGPSFSYFQAFLARSA